MKKLIFGLILTIIVSFFGWWFFIRTPDELMKITVIITPYKAKLEIDGKEVSKNNLKLKPNQEYIIRISHDGFTTQEFKKIFIKNSKYKNDSTIAIGLIPETDQAEKIAAKEDHLYMEIEGLSGSDSTVFLDEVNKNYPFLTSLPIQLPNYQVNYEVSNNSEITIIITADKLHRMQALSDLKRLNVDFSTQKIIFHNDQDQIINPFDEYKGDKK